MSSLIIIICIVYLVSAYVALADLQERAPSSEIARTMGFDTYMVIGLFCGLLPVLNSVLAYDIVFNKKKRERAIKTQQMQLLKDMERDREKEYLRLTKQADERLYKNDPEYYCEVNKLKYYPGMPFEQVWQMKNYGYYKQV